jgi:drug/metabolite transporter (DMT)-like permease
VNHGAASLANPLAPPATPEFITGAACAVAAVAIWAGWLVIMRLGVTTRVAAPDLAALRFGTSGLILLPIVLRRGLALDRLGLWGFAALAIGGGAPYLLVVGVGLLFAPVAHAGALTQGIVPLTVALVAAIILKERLAALQKLGLALVVCGGLVIGGVGRSALGSAATFGHLCFLATTFLCAFYTVALRRAHLDGLHAAAIAAVPSLVIYLPIYTMLFGDRVLHLPLADIVLQALYQGVLTGAISIALYGRAIRLLGASGASAFVALGPVIAAVISIPVLGERPSPLEWLAILVISSGVYLASGVAPLWSRRRVEQSDQHTASEVDNALYRANTRAALLRRHLHLDQRRCRPRRT